MANLVHGIALVAVEQFVQTLSPVEGPGKHYRVIAMDGRGTIGGGESRRRT